jgi:hypothetical protein
MPAPTDPGTGVTNAERIVAGSILDALTRTVFVDYRGDVTSPEPAGHAVLLAATPSPDRRIITVRVEPFDSEQVVEIQVLLGPPRVVTGETTGGNGIAP